MAIEDTASSDEDDNDEARRNLAAQMRRGMHLLAGRAPTTDQLETLVDALEHQFDGLESSPPRARTSPMGWPGADESELPGDGDPLADSLTRPISGHGHPFSVPITMYRDGDSVTCTVTLGDGFEGAPGRSHGGIVSAIFDDVFGSVPQMQGKIAFTASLTVKYVAPFPVHEPVSIRCWLDRVEGKKIYLLGEAHHGDTLVTSASALFIDAADFIAANYGPEPT